MKRIILLGIILVSITMVSNAIAVPFTESQPIVEKINKFENIRKTIDSIPFVGGLIRLISMLIGSLLLIPTFIFLIFGLAFLSAPMPMKIGGGVFTLIGLFGGIISLIFISLGLGPLPQLRKPLTLLIIFILPAIISILIINKVLG